MQYHEIRIHQVVDESPEARSFVLDIPPRLAEAFAYRAGQFLTFEMQVAGATLARCYSLASCPETAARPKVTVKRIADGRVSHWMNDQLKAGDVVRVAPPSGRFVLRDGVHELLLFAGGSGITPVISLVKSALHHGARRLRLVYANQHAGSVIFEAELDALVASAGGRLELVHRLDDRDGFVEEAAARALAFGFETADCYICGPGPFMDVVESALLGIGVPWERIFIERFVSPPDGEVAPVALSPDEVKAAATQIVVHLDGETRNIPYRAGQSILEAAQKAGMDPPFACTEGYCGSCAARVVQGEVKMPANDVFTAREVESGHVLTCQGRVVSSTCEINYEE